MVQSLPFQDRAFRGKYENQNSNDRRNFLQMLDLLASYNEKVALIIFHKASKNATYISLKI